MIRPCFKMSGGLTFLQKYGTPLNKVFLTISVTYFGLFAAKSYLDLQSKKSSLKAETQKLEVELETLLKSAEERKV